MQSNPTEIAANWVPSGDDGAPATNVALAANGGVASASSYLGAPYNYYPSYVNDGARRALNGAIWLDNTIYSFSDDSIEVDFNGSKTISEIDVVTQQDDYQNPVEPTLGQTMSLYGITAFDVQYWNGLTWVTVPNGNVTGNNKVWRQFTFASVPTSKIRVVVHDSADHVYSRVVELEAWTPGVHDGGGGWYYTYQSYDWKGRPLVTTNTDGTQKSASYSACGCVGSEVTTLTDEGTLVNGELKHRTQKIYSDPLGRTAKTEVLNWDGSIYSTAANTYNARDQVTLLRQYAGSDQNTTYQDTTASYDGYGRLSTRHAPEQNAGTATVYNYNADDTVNSVTDARGASTTYTYNNRHLVSAINYSAPSGITATPNVSFGYDAVGNRTSMTDGLGSATYSYNELSRMTSETRTYNGVGSYTLSYNYNLAGELKTVVDPWGATVTYGFDATGRLNGITGTGYGNGSQLLSNMQYRAWGTLKSETFGNGITENASYNSRLQMTGFDVRWQNNQLAMSHTHQYYTDGQLQFSHDALDERFDRAYSFDHAMRVNEAYSGSEARDFVNHTSSGAPTGPYRQSYQYSPFNQTAQQTDRLWSYADNTASTFTNNRRADWLYDAAGQVTGADALSFTRDVTNQIITETSESITRSNKFDGDGKLVWTSLTRPNFLGVMITTATYYLESTVLGGLAVAELTANGQKTVGHVYAAGRHVAAATGAYLTFSHGEPVTGSRGTSTPDGLYAPKSEYNADGIDVGFSDPALESGGGGSEGPAPDWLGGNFGPGSTCSNADPNCTSCYLDGFETDCGHVGSLIGMGAAEQCPNNDCGPHLAPDKNGNPVLTPLTRNPNNGMLGYWGGGYNAPGIVHDAMGNPMRLSHEASPAAAGGGTPIYGAFRVNASAVADNGDSGEVTGDWEYYVTGYAETMIPQNPVTFLTAQLLSHDKDPQVLCDAKFEPTGFGSDRATLNVESSSGPASLSGDVFTVRVNFLLPEYTKTFARGPADFGSRVVLGNDNRYRFPTVKEAPFGSSYAFADDGNRHGHVDISLKVRDAEATRNSILVTVAGAYGSGELFSGQASLKLVGNNERPKTPCRPR